VKVCLSTLLFWHLLSKAFVTEENVQQLNSLASESVVLEVDAALISEYARFQQRSTNPKRLALNEVNSSQLLSEGDHRVCVQYHEPTMEESN